VVYTFSPQYKDSGRAKEIKIKWEAEETASAKEIYPRANLGKRTLL
jgi:hypothetical protein